MKITLPDYLTLKAWADWNEVEKDNSLYYKIYTISCVTGMTIDEVKALPAEILPKLFSDCADVIMEERMGAYILKYKGKKLGFSAPHLGSIGEVAEIEEMLKSDKPYNVLRLLFRNVTVDNTEGEWDKLSDSLEVKYLTDFNKQIKDYEVEDYDYEKIMDSDLGNDDFWDDFPQTIYSAILGFIVGIGTTSYSASVLYSRQQKFNPEQMKRYTALQSLISDGLERVLLLQRLTFSPLQKSLT